MSTYTKIQNCFLIIFFIVFASPIAKAEDIILKQINKNIVSVYSSAAECMNTIYPGPEQYVTIIKEYFEKLYPDGTGYWTLPPVKQLQLDRGVCIINLETSIQRYQRSLYDFYNTYPDRKQPPMLMAYNWRDSITNSDKNIAIKQPLPILKTPKKSEEQRF